MNMNERGFSFVSYHFGERFRFVLNHYLIDKYYSFPDPVYYKFYCASFLTCFAYTPNANTVQPANQVTIVSGYFKPEWNCFRLAHPMFRQFLRRNDRKGSSTRLTSILHPASHAYIPSLLVSLTIRTRIIFFKLPEYK